MKWEHKGKNKYNVKFECACFSSWCTSKPLVHWSFESLINLKVLMQWNPLNQFNRNSYKLFVTPLHNIFFGTLTVVYSKQNYNSLVNVCATPDLKNRITIIGTKNIFNRIKPFPEGEM